MPQFPTSRAANQAAPWWNAAVLDHTLTKYQGRTKPEEAKALLITAYIQRGRHAAYGTHAAVIKKPPRPPPPSNFLDQPCSPDDD
jgi:hypothetical protein